MKKILSILLFLIPAPLFASQIWVASGVCDALTCGSTGVAQGTAIDFILELADGTSTTSFTFDKSEFISLSAVLDPLGTPTPYNFTVDLSVDPSTFLWGPTTDYLFVQVDFGNTQFCSDASGSGCSAPFDGLIEWSGDNATGPLIAGSGALDWQLQAVPIPAAVWLFGSALAGLGWVKRRQSA